MSVLDYFIALRVIVGKPQVKYGHAYYPLHIHDADDRALAEAVLHRLRIGFIITSTIRDAICFTTQDDAKHAKEVLTHFSIKAVKGG